MARAGYGGLQKPQLKGRIWYELGSNSVQGRSHHDSSKAPTSGTRASEQRPDQDVSPPIRLSTLVVGDTAVVRVQGDLDHHTGSQLVAWAKPILEGDARNLVVDCGGTAFLDSGGFKVLVELRDPVHNHSCTLTVRNCSESIRRLFDVIALAQFLGVEPPRRP